MAPSIHPSVPYNFRGIQRDCGNFGDLRCSFPALTSHSQYSGGCDLRDPPPGISPEGSGGPAPGPGPPSPAPRGTPGSRDRWPSRRAKPGPGTPCSSRAAPPRGARRADSHTDPGTGLRAVTDYCIIVQRQPGLTLLGLEPHLDEVHGHGDGELGGPRHAARREHGCVGGAGAGRSAHCAH